MLIVAIQITSKLASDMQIGIKTDNFFICVMHKNIHDKAVSQATQNYCLKLTIACIKLK